MKVISFEEKSCERIRKFLDAHISNELPRENELEVVRHIEQCQNCAEELKTRKRVKNALKQAVNRQKGAPADLRQKILTEIGSKSNRNYWWLAAAAAVILPIGILAVFGVFRWNSRIGSGISMPAGGSELISANNAEVFNIGLGDHIHCALHRDYSEGPRSFERMSHDMGPEYIGLIPLVKTRVAQNYTVMVGHKCDFKGRNFVHLILTNQSTILSVILTKKNGENFDKNAMTEVMQASGTPLYRARMQDQEIAGFETRDYLAYMVSGLPQQEHMQLASSLAPSMHDFLRRLEG